MHNASFLLSTPAPTRPASLPPPPLLLLRPQPRTQPAPREPRRRDSKDAEGPHRRPREAAAPAAPAPSSAAPAPASSCDSQEARAELHRDERLGRYDREHQPGAGPEPVAGGGGGGGREQQCGRQKTGLFQPLPLLPLPRPLLPGDDEAVKLLEGGQAQQEEADEAVDRERVELRDPEGGLEEKRVELFFFCVFLLFLAIV